MTALILDTFVKSTALLLAAAAIDLALARRASAAARHLLWALTVAALLLLPLAAALPGWHVRIPVARAGAAITAAPQGVIVDARSSLRASPTARPDALKTARPRGEVAAVSRPAGLGGAFALVALAGIYLAGVLVLAARVACEPLALRRLAAASRPIDGPAWRGALDDAVRQLGVARSVRLLESAQDIMPLTFGTSAPVIVVPAAAEGWSEDRRRAVLLHELAHVARFDCMVQRLTAAACALYWPHPGVWWAARRLRVERELACDDRVLGAGAGPREYAEHLLEIARAFGPSPAPATALGMIRARQLEGRMLAILDAARNRAALGRRGVTAAIAATAALCLPLAIVHAALVPFDPLVANGSAVERAGVAQSSPAPAQAEATGTWELRRTAARDTVQINIRTDQGSHGRTVGLDRLAGLPVDQIDGLNAPLHFPIRREAGTFTVDGVCRRGVCAGTFAFAPDAAFAEALATRGIGRPSPQESLSLAIADVGVAYLDALAAAGYAKPDVPMLVRAAQHGVDADYLHGMTALGYRAGSLDALITLRDHGVDSVFIRGMEAAGYAHLSAEELRVARDHGADPEYARGMTALGFPAMSLSSLIEARDHGVEPEYVRGMQALGYRLTLDEYRRARDHGVGAEYARGLASLGYPTLTIDALLTARDHGVDPEYVRGMAELGYKGVPLQDLVRLRDHGVDPEYVRRLQRAGSPHLSVDEVIQRRDRGEEDPDAAVQAIASRLRAVWRNVNAWLRG
jgi:beta-lactamase regulating signal transducer with metallopeptidase domain